MAVPANLVVGDTLGGQGAAKADVVQFQANNQIQPTAAVTIFASGLLNLNGFNNTIGNGQVNALTITGGSVATGTGTLTLGSNVADLAANTDITPASISGNLNLGGTTRTFDVAAGILGGENPNGTVQTPGVALPNTNDMAISAVISNGGLNKIDTGKLQLTGNNGYTGTTTVSGGTLLVDGTQTGSAVTVNSPATLGGTGQTGTVTLAGGTVSPGDPTTTAGVLSATGATNLSNNGSLTVQLPAIGTAGINYDELNVTGAGNTGNLTLGGTSTLTVDLNGLSTTGVFSNVIVYTGTLTGTFGDTNGTNLVNPANVINNPNNWQVLVDYSHAGAIYLDVFGASSTLGFVTQPSTTAAGNAISPSLQIAVEDSFGTLVPTNSGTSITVSANGPGAFAGSSITTVPTTNGVAIFNNLILNTVGSYTLTAAATGFSNVNSNSFSVTGGRQVSCGVHDAATDVDGWGDLGHDHPPA